MLNQPEDPIAKLEKTIQALQNLRAKFVALHEKNAAVVRETVNIVPQTGKANERKRIIADARAEMHQIEYGVSVHEGMSEELTDLVRPLFSQFARPGLREIDERLFTLKRDRDRELALQAKWPTPESTRPFRWTHPVPGVHHGGVVKQGDVIQLTRNGAAGLVNKVEEVKEVEEQATAPPLSA